MQLTTVKFTSWDDLPSVKHLEDVKNSYIHAAKGDIIYVSYITENDKIVAFGSCGYYKDENYYSRDNRRQLWIEGMVSIVSGYGSIILRELERVLIELANLYKVKERLINVMSVGESVEFYEKNEYIECTTSARFRSTGNIRCVKAIHNFSLENAKIVVYSQDPEDIVMFIFQGRRLRVDEYLNIPNHVKPKELTMYFFENRDNDTVYKPNVLHLKQEIIEAFLDINQRKSCNSIFTTINGEHHSS